MEEAIQRLTLEFSNQLAALQRDLQATVGEVRSQMAEVAVRISTMEEQQRVREAHHEGVTISGRRTVDQAHARAQRPTGDRSAQDTPTPEDDDEPGPRQRWAHLEKTLMSGIEECKRHEDWLKLVDQIRMSVDIHYPAVHNFVREMRRMEQRPSLADLKEVSMRLNMTSQEFTRFMEDLWKVLILKTKGPVTSILRHVVDTESAPLLRTPVAWWELEKEAEGASWARKRDLAKWVVHPTRARGWADIPEAIRTFENRVAEFELVTEGRIDPELRVQGLLGTIPQFLEKQMQSQAGITRTYSGFKEYVLEQTYLNRPSTTARHTTTPSTTPGTTDVEAAGLTATTGWYDDEQRWHEEQWPAHDSYDGHDGYASTPHDDAQHEPAQHDTFAMKGNKGKGKEQGGKSKGKGKANGFPGVCWHCNMPGHRKFECYLYIGGKKGGKSGGSKGGKLGKGYGKFGYSQPTTHGGHSWSGKGGMDWGWPAYGINNQNPTQPWGEAGGGDWAGQGSAQAEAEPETYTSLFSCVRRTPAPPQNRFEHSNPWAALANDDDETADSTACSEPCCGPRPRKLGDWMAQPRIRTKRRQKTSPVMMIDVVRPAEAQSVVHNANDLEWQKVDTFMDSGAARSVCPLTFCDEVPLTESAGSKAGEQFRTASGTRLLNRGDRVVRGQGPNGELLAMRYAVADVAMALDSVSQICDTGAQVLFTKWGGHILGPAGRVDFTRVGDTYVRSTWVKRPKKRIPKPEVTNDNDVDMTQKAIKSVTRPFGRLGTTTP